LYYTFRLFSSQLLAIWRVVVQGGLEHERRERARNTRKHFAPFVAFRVSRGPNRPLALAEQRCGQLRQFHRGQLDGWLFGVACLLTAGDGRDEQSAAQAIPKNKGHESTSRLSWPFA
jgi:hypothetical protein